MTRKFKTLGVALFAVLALSAVSASAASAVNYTAASYPTTGTATSPAGNDTFITEAGVVECASHFQGTLTAASKTLTVTPTYTNCKAFGFVNATVSMGTCDYLFNEPTGSGHAYNASVSVKCAPTASTGITDPITITAGTCKVTIGTQNPAGSVAITNNTAAGDVSVKASVTGINYTVVTDGFGCPFNGIGPKTEGGYFHHSAVTFDSTNGSNIHVG